MAYSAINKSTQFFNTVTYTGSAGGQTISGVGHQPDFIWVKQTGDAGYSSSLHNSASGLLKQLKSNSNAAQITNTDTVTSANADGFVLGADTAGPEANSNNQSGKNYIAWNWKAGTTSGITTDGNTDITPSAYSFNQTSGFSVLTYTGTGNNGAGVAHGLGKKPQFYMVKRTDTTGSWQVYWQPILNTSNATKYMILDSSGTEGTNNNRWYGYQPDTKNFYLGNSTEVNANGGTYVAYVYANITGYSKLGSYTGNGAGGSNPNVVESPFVYTGFKPEFLMIKHTGGGSAGSENWNMQDWKRANSMNFYGNPSTVALFANNDSENNTTNNNGIDFLSNGFKVRNNDGRLNNSGASYLYLAFGQTLVGSNNIPCTAR